MSEDLSSILLNKTNHHLTWPGFLQKQLKKIGKNCERMYTPMLFLYCLPFFSQAACESISVNEVFNGTIRNSNLRHNTYSNYE